MLSRQDKLDMALMSGHAGDKAREVVPMRSNLHGMCVSAEQKKTTCDGAWCCSGLRGFGALHFDPQLLYQNEIYE